ncbi:hypothetical protein MHBO_001494 [Bonamia ostreae]|uniref:4a-hydroxytetrahydrobiopterin dehydratase n=1 Tax=Bonamia ostreae TaxID=126728 RepID=A0ABV2AJ69_9EUKA
MSSPIKVISKTKLPGWRMVFSLKSFYNKKGKDGRSITKLFKFVNFKHSLFFMTQAGYESEGLNHHPEWSNVYNKVNVRLTTHSAKNLTIKDFELAEKMDQIEKLIKAP